MMWDGDGPWQHHWWLFGPGGWWMGIGMIALIAVTVVLIVYLVRSAGTPATQVRAAAQHPAQAAPNVAAPEQAAAAAGPPETPRDIVKRRYAGGEIDREEYLQKLADL